MSYEKHNLLNFCQIILRQAWVAAFAILAGCGSTELETAEVVGTVTIDGEPLTQGSVIFNPSTGWPGRGEIDSQGSFVLSTYSENDGAIVGTHQVAVIAETGVDDSQHFEGPPPEPIRSMIPPHYGNKATSGLRVEVESDKKNEVELQLTSERSN